MVDREHWGQIKNELENLTNDIIEELCYILNLNRSGRKDQKIQEILKSEFDYQYVNNRLNFLLFGLKLLDYFSVSELTDITREYDLPKQNRKWNKIVEIIRSEEVTPRTLLGQLSDEQLEDMYEEIFDEETNLGREGLIKAVIQQFNLSWLEEIMNSGFILMAMAEDPDLERVYQIIKDEAHKCDIKAERIDEIHTSGRITNEVLEKIKTSDYIFIDLTLERPNVYYELGYCHGLGKDFKKIILMAKNGTKLHFDIKDMRTIYYENPHHLKHQLNKRLKGITNLQ